MQERIDAFQKRLRMQILRLALALTLTLGVVACSDDNGNPNSPSSTTATTDATAVIANNHGHVAVVTLAQINAGNALTLNITGSADHSHTVDLTNDDVVRLRTRQRVERDSTPQNQHTHHITFN
jgi:ABC-type Fe3+-citrate transport system substrate-binding protein